MTSRDKLIENYEDALFALMMDTMAQSEGTRLLQENEALQADAGATVPPEIHKHCLKTIRSGLVRRNSVVSFCTTGRLLGRLTAAVFITAALFTAAFASSSSFRTGTLNLLMDIDAELVQWSFETEDDTTLDTVSLELLWLPDGYVLEEEANSVFSSTLTYRNSSGGKIRISSLKGSHTAMEQTDKEDADYWDECIIHGASAVVIKKGSKISISWFDPNYAVLIDVYSDVLSIEQLKEVAENVIISP